MRDAILQRARILLTAASVVTLSCMSPTPGLDRAWVRVSLPGLEIISAQSAAETEALARELALFREIVLEVTNIAGRPRVPTRMLVVDSATYRKIVGRSTSGVFSRGIRDDVMVISEQPAWRRHADDRTQREVIQHEYVHFLMENEQSAHYPLWFNEGWAELLSTVRVSDQEIVIGTAPTQQTFILERARPWLRLSEVVTATRYPRQVYLFYAQSWALVHYLQLGRQRRGEFHHQLGDYVSALTDGVPAERAFETAFATDLETLEERLAAYAIIRSFPTIRIPRDRFPPSPVLASESLRAAEVADALGWLSLRAEEPKLAIGYFESALAADARLARSHTGLGRARAADDDWDAALADARRGVALDAATTAERLDLAQLLTARASREDLPEAEVSHRDAWLAEARGLFRAAIAEDPERPEPYLGLGETHLAPDQSVGPARAPLERALDLLPIHPATRIALARVYADAGRDEEALALLSPIVATQAETPAGAEALALIEEHGFRDHEEKNDAN